MEELNTVVEKVTEEKGNNSDALKGIIVIAAVGGIGYAIGRRRGVEACKRSLELYLRGLEAGCEMAESGTK